MRDEMRLVIVTMDTHLSSATAMAAARLARQYPGLHLDMHAASEYSADPAALARVKAAISSAHVVLVSMLFLEDHFLPVLDDLKRRRDDLDALICIMSAPDVVKLTRMGRFDMSKPASGPMALLKRLRGKRPGENQGAKGGRSETSGSGASQMKMLRRLPKILRFIPGTAQDIRLYFLSLQYWLGGSDANMESLAGMLVNRYAAGPRQVWQGRLPVAEPIEYPDLGVYHPKMAGRIADQADRLPGIRTTAKPRVGLLMLRSYLLAGNTAHYDGMIAALEAKGLTVVPAFAMGLDARPAIEAFFMRDGRVVVDAVVSLTGFSLVGGPAYNDAQAAEDILTTLNVPYLAAHPLEFQSLADWGGSNRGLMPVETTIMVAIPELDGATSPMVFGGRPGVRGQACQGCHRGCEFNDINTPQDMVSCPERAEMLAARVARLITLRKTPVEDRRVALVLFNFPPNGGSVGTAAHLSVFESVYETLKGMAGQGYRVDLPASGDAIREQLLNGNRAAHGTDANVLASISVQDHLKKEVWLKDIEACWGPAPGRQLTNGKSLFVLGVNFGNVSVLVQPGFGVEGDPMRLLFEHDMTPTHAFAAFYRHLREDLQAHAVVHFGTHGALEFMPGKQAGSSGRCWPDRLIADLPNFYIYASNNPSEGTIAKRRSSATLVSYLTPAVTEAGLYRGLSELKQSLDRWRSLSPTEDQERARLMPVIAEQAKALEFEFSPIGEATSDATAAAVLRLTEQLHELEHTLIPQGLHVLGRAMSAEQRADVLLAMARAHRPLEPTEGWSDAVAAILGSPPEQALSAALRHVGSRDTDRGLLEQLIQINTALQTNQEVAALLEALNGNFVRPAPGGDLLRTPEVLPTGRNVHGFDPFRMPSRYAWVDGQQQAEKLLARHRELGHPMPESIAMVLWGTDNLKTEGSPLAQAMALMGAEPRFDGFGRLAGASLITLEALGRPRIDVVLTLSGIFRDLLPLQIRMLAEAAFLAASADEPTDMNFVRKHVLAHMQATGADLETSALRVFGNADGAYGANVNHLIEQGCWQDEDELADCYARRKGFAYGRNGRPSSQPELLQAALGHVTLAYQNLESMEVGVTTVDTYFDTLGGVSRAVRKARGGQDPMVYIGDQTTGSGVVRTLSEQVGLETRTRMLNPKWYESMLEHGYEGVRQIEAHLTNTMGWSATTGQVQPWVYQQLTQTFLLDPVMRERLAELNPAASAKLAGRLLEASDRSYWTPDEQTLNALREAGEAFEDRIEGIYQGAPV
ncbi:MAG: magnesium chelatase subunit H [Burkholderiaceae bacterium]